MEVTSSTPSPSANEQNTLAVQAFKGLHLEPPTRDVVEFDENVEPVTKEEEIITKKKTELTTTRQIETRVKRQVVLEDGKVVQDSGPIVETNTTEDTDKQESKTTERRNLDSDDVDGHTAATTAGGGAGGTIEQNVLQSNELANLSPGVVRAIVKKPDGLVREINTNTIISREEVDELLETEDIKYLGDFSDQAYVNAVNSGKNIKEELLSPNAQRQLIPTGPRIVHQTTKAHKTIDTENTNLKCLAQPDGTLVTEKKNTTEHEEIFDEDLPEKDDNSTGSREKIDNTESSQRYYKQRDEQAVEYIADGKLIGKEIRYAAETSQMDRDGPTENASDWDSLSDRVRKARRQQKTLLQQHREALDRKDALTDRPLDFDKEEQTRKGETIKWLESHFGSESRSSRDSRDDTRDVEPTKKTYFNVTIKSTPKTPPSPHPKSDYNSNIVSPSKVNIPEREISKPKYFHGISEWADRKDKAPKNFPSKSFQEELSGTLERNRLKQFASREDLRYGRTGKNEYLRKKEEQRAGLRSDIKKFSSQSDLRHRRESRGGSDESRQLKTQKEDLGYLSGSRNDVRPIKSSKEELYAKSKKQNGYLHREDSGYVKGSREDVHYIKNSSREDSFIRDSGEEERIYEPKQTKSAIQRDDSAYVSSSTFFTAPRSPKSPPLRTPDSGIRSPSPYLQTTAVEDVYDSEGIRPTVPQRKRAIEKKLHLNQNGYGPSIKRSEPPPDYSPPSRSRSASPPARTTSSQTSGIKKYQRTRFASETPRPVATQTTQTTQTQTIHPLKQSNKVSTVIGNSIRKLVGKIRSASAERKLKIKAKRSASPHKSSHPSSSLSNVGSTYQQYNVIDSHIGNGNREASITSASSRRGGERSIEFSRGLSEIDMASPKQKYYLGEDPYGGSIFGKENKYDGVRPQRNPIRRLRSEDISRYPSPSRMNTTPPTQTLGRFSKSTNRLTATSSNQNDYRSTQTLPRKLEHKPSHSSAINIAIARPPQNTGPAKPARTYKSLIRSKSFNVHGMNGTNDPSPIYMEKLNSNYSNSMYKSNPHLNEEKLQLKSPSIVNLISRSQRDLTKIDEDSQYNGYRSEGKMNGYNNHVMASRNGGHHDKKNIFMRSLQDRAPELYRTLNSDEENRKNFHKYSVERNIARERESSLGSRSPITINKDTASIVRRGSTSTEDFSETYKITSKSDDPHRPSITNTVHSYTKKTIPTKYGRGTETIESTERKTVSSSRYGGNPKTATNLRYADLDRGGRSPGPVIIEVKHHNSRM